MEDLIYFRNLQGKNMSYIDKKDKYLTYHQEVIDYIDLNNKLFKLCKTHNDYLKTLNQPENSVIYDIGSCALQWSNAAKELWPTTNIYHFEANPNCKKLYEDRKVNYHIGLLSDEDGKELDFYLNDFSIEGNSYYKEVGNPMSDRLYTDKHKVRMLSQTLDTIVREKDIPLPNMIKIDVQGAELDVMKGAQKCINNAKDIIVELQHTEYNKGAPKLEICKEFLEKNNFKLVKCFSKNNYDGDYHFTKI